MVGPSRTSDVGLLSNRKMVQTEELQRQRHLTRTTVGNNVEGCVQGSHAVRVRKLSEELRGPQPGRAGICFVDGS